MILALAVGALDSGAGRTRVASLLGVVGRIDSVELRLIDSNAKALIDITEWRSEREEDLARIIEEIAGCAAKHKGAGATIRVRRVRQENRSEKVQRSSHLSVLQVDPLS